MSRRVVPLTCDLLSSLPGSARSCAYWELDPVQRGLRQSASDRIAAKERWLSSTLLEWGSCGQVVLMDDRPAAYLLYAPPAFVPSAASLPTAPVAHDALLLTRGEVFPDYRARGLGRLLVQTVVKEAVRRNVRAVEAFATYRPHVCTGDASQPCVLPVEFLSAVGFRTARTHPVTPRLRLDIRSVAHLRADVETAVDRLLGGLWPAARVN